MKYCYLSYSLDTGSPIYGGGEHVSIARVRAIRDGDSANTYRFSLKSHSGTHIDGPNHFFEKGKKISDYPAESCFFKFPFVVRVNLMPSEILTCKKLKKGIPGNCEILLLKSGWSGRRRKKDYVYDNPGVHPEVGVSLRKNFPRLRAIGIDWLSISSYQNRPLGRQAHKACLDPRGPGKPVLLIEDMDLSKVSKRLKEVYVFPLRVKDLDSAPCTVVGGFR